MLNHSSHFSGVVGVYSGTRESKLSLGGNDGTKHDINSPMRGSGNHTIQQEFQHFQDNLLAPDFSNSMLGLSPFLVLHLEFSFIEVNPFPAMWSSWFMGCEDYARCLVDSWDPLFSHTPFWNSSQMQFRASQTPSWCYLVMGFSSFLLAFFPKNFRRFSDIWINKVNSFHFFEHCRAPISLLPILVFSRFWEALPILVFTSWQ